MNDNKFDDGFRKTSTLIDNHMKNVNQGMKVFLFIWAGSAITSLTILGLIVWAVVHFLSKVW